jgi:hypothetical protein
MDKVLILFLIGIAAGVLVPIIEKGYSTAQLLEEPLTVIQRAFTAAAQFWHLGISMLILITLPSAIFKRIRDHLHKKQFLPIPFMTGLSFGFTFMGVVGIISSHL